MKKVNLKGYWTETVVFDKTFFSDPLQKLNPPNINIFLNTFHILLSFFFPRRVQHYAASTFNATYNLCDIYI